MTGHDGRELGRGAIVHFDPCCKTDVMSTDFLKKRFNLSYPREVKETLGCSITGREAFESVGRQDIRWWAPNLNRYEDSSCHLIESNMFDLIIGKDTITRLVIFEVRRSIIAAFMTPRPGLNGASTRRNIEVPSH